MSAPGEVWAVVPVKATQDAKQRLAPALSPALRQGLALAMLEDVLSALAAVDGLGGVVLVTVDPAAGELARHFGFTTIADGAHDGHTGAVMAGARYLAAHGRRAMLTLPGDLPLVSAAEIAALIAAHGPEPSFTIAPSHDELGSNAILMSPPQAVPLRFGDDSFFPHLAAARACGIEPCIVRLPGLAWDIDNPQDLDHLLPRRAATRAGQWITAQTGAAPQDGVAQDDESARSAWRTG